MRLNSTTSLRGQDIEENWQIDSQKLRVFDDEILGEGEFGIVKKGHYGGRNVAVKQLKGAKRYSIAILYNKDLRKITKIN